MVKNFTLPAGIISDRKMTQNKETSAQKSDFCSSSRHKKNLTTSVLPVRRGFNFFYNAEIGQKADFFNC